MRDRARSAPSFLAGPSLQRKDRPISTEGRLSQPNTAHLPSEMADLPAGLEMHMDVPPGEGLEEPPGGRGPPLLTEQSYK